MPYAGRDSTSEFSKSACTSYLIFVAILYSGHYVGFKDGDTKIGRTVGPSIVCLMWTSHSMSPGVSLLVQSCCPGALSPRGPGHSEARQCRLVVRSGLGRTGEEPIMGAAGPWCWCCARNTLCA